MDKEALLNIILNDLKEVETLVISFQGENKIADPFINLAERKLTHISEELNLLKTISVSAPKQNTDNLIVQKSVQPQKKESQETTPTPVLEQEINQETQQETKPEITNPEPKESLEPPKSTSIHTHKKDINIALEDVKEETVTESETLKENNIIQESHKSAPVQAPSTVKQEQPTPPPIEKVQEHQHEDAR